MLSTVRTYASFVKFSHTVFALPFAIAGMVAAYAVPNGILYYSPPPSWWTGPVKAWEPTFLNFSWPAFALILCCMVGARSFAMAVNRILDRKIDALNPRTAQRELPAGKITNTAAWGFAVTVACVYFVACYMLGKVVLFLSPIPIALMLLYPYTKRFLSFCHLVLGASLGIAPIGAWVAVRSVYLESIGFSAINYRAEWHSVIDPAPWILGAAVMFWVGGFDIIYALQDDAFDREHGLYSIPAALGRRSALWVARGLHLCGAALFFAFIYCTLHRSLRGYDVSEYVQLAPWVWAAPCVMLVGMIYQHSLVKPNDLSRVNVAFFTVNGIISVIFGAIFVAAWLLA